MIKVMHIINGLGSGGAEMTLSQLVRTMDRSEFANIVVSLKDEGFHGPDIQAQNIPVYTLNLKSGFPNPAVLYRLYKIIKHEKPEIIQSWLYLSDIVGLICGKLGKVPFIFWNIRCSDPHRGSASFRKRFLHKLLAFFSQFPNCIIANSMSGIQYHQTLGYRPKIWEFIPNGYNTETLKPSIEKRVYWRNRLNIPENFMAVGLIARFDRLKDLPTFIEAASLLTKKFPHTKFCLVGEGMAEQNQELKNLLKSTHQEPFFCLAGRQKDIPGILSAFDVFSLSSISEGFPNVVAEAMSCGLPPVVTDVGDSKFIVGDAGIVVPPKDPKALAQAWAKILSLEPAERIKMGEKAREKIKSELPLVKMTAKYESIYKRVKLDHF